MTNSIGHRVIAISRIFLKDQWKFLPWWLLSKSEYNGALDFKFLGSQKCQNWHCCESQKHGTQKGPQLALSVLSFFMMRSLCVLVGPLSFRREAALSKSRVKEKFCIISVAEYYLSMSVNGPIAF